MVAIGASSGLNCPDALLRAVGERYAATGHPSSIKVFAPISAGDMYGIKGIDHLAQDGLIDTIVGGSYPSGPSSLPPPAIRLLMQDDRLAAYNFPSGIMFEMLRNSASKGPGLLTKVGLGTFVDPRLEGGCMNGSAQNDGSLVRHVDFAGEEWLHFSDPRPDIAIIRRTTADPRGNISMEHEGAVLGMLDMAMAVHNNGGTVICQVKRMVGESEIPAQAVHIPSTLVDYVVVDHAQLQATQIQYDPALSGEVRRPLSDFEPQALDAEKLIARRAAREAQDGMVVNLGFGLATLIPRVMLEEGRDGAVTWTIEQGAIGGVPMTGFAFGCSTNAEAFLDCGRQFTYFQGGGHDCAFLSFLEVDRHGNVNVSRLPGRPHLTVGVGGFIDITARVRKVVFSGFFTAIGLDARPEGGWLEIRREGDNAKFVHAVNQVTFNGQLALDRGQDVTYVTERCVLKLTEKGLKLIEIAPGIDLARDIVGRCSFPLLIDSELREMDRALFTEQRRSPM